MRGENLGTGRKLSEVGKPQQAWPWLGLQCFRASGLVGERERWWDRMRVDTDSAHQTWEEGGRRSNRLLLRTLKGAGSVAVKEEPVHCSQWWAEGRGQWAVWQRIPETQHRRW